MNSILRNTHTLLCFGAAPGDGNPALVIEGDLSDAAARQALARARDTTCVFIDEVEDKDGGGVRVDYFYPHMRSPLCLHATLAAAAVLFACAALAPQPAHAHARELVVHTAMHGQRLVLSRDDDDYFVRLAPQPAPRVDVDDDRLARLLRVSDFAARSAPRTASVGSPKLLVEVAGPDALHALAPDLDAIVAWGRDVGVNGIYAWCRSGSKDSGGAFEGRNFNHLDPRLEDSATGVAAGALAIALGHGLTVRQGRDTGRDCLIRVRLDGGDVLVGGAAEFA